MPENERDSNSQSSLAKFTGIGFQMIAVIGLFTYAGYKIDKSTQHTTQWCTAVFSLVGVLVAIYLVIKSLKN